MLTILEQIALCTKRGKVDRASPYPPDMANEDGVAELSERALAEGVEPNALLNDGLMVGMEQIGQDFADQEAFVPDLLMAARAMSVGMERLGPYFDSGAATRRGTFVIGTVQGDLHDIGKNLVRMILEGGGWQVIDLGVDAPTDRFVQAVASHPGCFVGLSAMLTTTMATMENTVKAIRTASPDTRILIGGAPVTQSFSERIGADCYAPDPYAALSYLSAVSA